MSADAEMFPAGDALQHYVDALLELMPAAGEASPLPETAAPASGENGLRRYRVCTIASIRLALPAEAVLEPVPLPPLLAYSAPHGYLGRHRLGGTEWKVVDLASLAAPGVPHPLPDALLPLADQPWALACSIEPSWLELDADAVQWREGGGPRPWLAGMTREGACAIIDLETLAAMLQADPRFAEEV
jgi:hypothetical protein